MLKALALTSQPGQFVLPVGLYSCQGENKSHTEAPLLYHIPFFFSFFFLSRTPAFVSREKLKTILHILKKPKAMLVLETVSVRNNYKQMNL